MKRIVKKAIALTVLFSLLIPGAVQVLAADGVCVLSDFEHGLEGWNNDFESTMYRTNEEAHSGQFSLETTVVNDWGCPKFYYRFIPGVKYRVSVWVKVKGAPNVAQVIFDYSAYGQTAPYWSFFGVNTPVNAEEWTEISFDYTYTGGNPDGKANIFVRIGDGKVRDFAAEDRVTYYIDDLKISYQNPNHHYTDTKLSRDETAVNMGFDLNTDGYYLSNAHMQHVKEGCNDTYGGALVIMDGERGYVGQKYMIEEGKEYYLSAYVKSPDGKIPFRYMVLEKVNGRSVSRPLSQEVFVGDNWTKIDAKYRRSNKEYSNDKIFYILAGNGTKKVKYLLDEFSILKYDSEQEEEYVKADKYFSNPGGGLTLNAGRGNLKGAVAPYFLNGEFMCQADLLAQAIGAESGFSEDGRFYFTKGVNTLSVKPYSHAAYYNNILKLQTNAPVLTDGKLILSAGFIAGVFGLESEYLSEHNIFYIDGADCGGNLASTVRKINHGEKIKVAFLGGSFQRGGDTDYPVVQPLKERVVKWFAAQYPNVETEVIDAEISGTDSTLGCYRLENDILQYAPDLVFIDFSINDFNRNHSAQTAVNIENILRRILQNKKDTDIVILNTADQGMIDVYENNREPFVTKIYRDLASYYETAFLDLGRVLYEDYKQSGADLTAYFIQNMQLTEKAASLYMDKTAEFLKNAIERNNNLYERRLPEEIFDSGVAYKMIGAEAATLDEGWTLKNSGISGVQGQKSVYSNSTGSELKVNFTGTSIGLLWQVSPKSGAIEYRVDSGAWKYLDVYDVDAYKYARPDYVILAEHLDNTEHTLTVKVSDKVNLKSLGNEIVIGGFLEKR